MSLVIKLTPYLKTCSCTTTSELYTRKRFCPVSFSCCKRYWCGEGIYEGRRNCIEDVNLRFYNGCEVHEYTDVPLNEACLLFDVDCFNKDATTMIYAHGYAEDGLIESVQVIMSAYLDGSPATNAILLDWANMAQGSYPFNAVRNTKKVGVAAAKNINMLLEAGLPLENLHLIGHSLGGHVVGYIARYLKNNCNKIVKRVTALDPARFGFYPKGCMEHISENDAEFVDIIHTDTCYGAPVRTGTADFWPNGAKRKQPGCPVFPVLPLSLASFCSHWRSWEFFAEAVRNPENFPASPAESYRKFLKNPSPEDGMVFMGLNCDVNARGSYYLKTNAKKPYGRGMEGICGRVCGCSISVT